MLIYLFSQYMLENGFLIVSKTHKKIVDSTFFCSKLAHRRFIFSIFTTQKTNDTISSLEFLCNFEDDKV